MIVSAGSCWWTARILPTATPCRAASSIWASPPSKPPSAKETNLRGKLTGLLGVYSAPDRDPRQHTISTVFIAEPLNPEQLRAGDDAAKVAFYSMEALPALVFDHAKILADFKGVLYGGRSAAGLTTPW